MKIENALAIGALTLGGLINLATNIEKDEETYKTKCETYQSGRTDDGDIFLTFKEEPYEERGLNKPNYALLGDSKMLEELEKGKQYKLEIRGTLIGLNRLISTEPCG